MRNSRVDIMAMPSLLFTLTSSVLPTFESDLWQRGEIIYLFSVRLSDSHVAHTETTYSRTQQLTLTGRNVIKPKTYKSAHQVLALFNIHPKGNKRHE